MQPLRNPGPDGLVNTADDTGIETALNPGPDNVLGTADDISTELASYRREIEISEIVTNGVVNPNLRRLRVRVRYGKMIRDGQGELVPGAGLRAATYMSSIS